MHTYVLLKSGKIVILYSDDGDTITYYELEDENICSEYYSESTIFTTIPIEEEFCRDSNLNYLRNINVNI